MSILLSAFLPFSGDKENSSLKILERAQSVWKDPVELSFVVLPVTFEGAWRVLSDKIKAIKPSYVLAMGQDSGRARPALEQVALNWIDARIPDEEGVQPRGKSISKDEPLALWASLPNQNIIQRLTESGQSVDISYSAGTYVCNALMFDLLSHSAKNAYRAGFMHWPSDSDVNQSIEILKICVDCLSGNKTGN